MKKQIVFYVLIICMAFGVISAQEKEAIRGVWLTNVDSDALKSLDNIKKTVELCKEEGFNSIFVVTYNKGLTLYPSEVMKRVVGQEIDSAYIGRDPLKEIIKESHKVGIKVFAWFEFGFSSSYKLNGGRIIEQHPDWAAINNEGKLVTKNGFDWLNGFNPDVQNYMLSLIIEVVKNYEIDGIQGDDRLPAMPVESGYDEYTKLLYKKDNNDVEPPKDFRDSSWVAWRVKILNNYMESIYKTVKKINPNVLVTMAPSVFPWSVEEYLQDWVTWVKKGYVDFVFPQLYRKSVEEYIKTLDDIINTQLTCAESKKFYPGVLLKVGAYQPEEEMLKSIIKANRERGIEGEVFFFYEGIKKYPQLFKTEFYKNKVKFPQ